MLFVTYRCVFDYFIANLVQVLEEYVKLFDMREKTFVEALRAFLKEFRLPGEVKKKKKNEESISVTPRLVNCIETSFLWCNEVRCSTAR